MSAIWAFSLVAALAVSPASAFWRLPCKSPIVVERADPIVSPGQVSNHLHTIMGGNGFDFTMDYNSTQASTCSSCTVVGDNSNYWTPVLFFQHQNGTFERVPQIGGVTVYYLLRAGEGEYLKAFPPGFHMVAGDPFKRTGGDDFATQGISYNCLNYAGPGHPETPNFPTFNCPNGIRAQVFFPACWNGKDLDSPDHKSHVSYPVDAFNGGHCPPDFPIHFVSLFFEIIWDTTSFADKWYGDGQPFVWSSGDPTGYGGHGDFLMGWNPQLLQSAIDTCTADSGRVEDCPIFDLIPDSRATGCIVEPKVNEPVSGLLTALPGCNPIQPGPTASPKSGCGAPTQVTPLNETLFTDLTSKGWSYVGCGVDNYADRILKSAWLANDQMTNENCVTFCESKGFSIAGTEYAGECYCADSIPASGAPIPGVPGNCRMNCKGDNAEFCGGVSTISLYQKCTGDTCTNAQPGGSSKLPSSSSSSTRKPSSLPASLPASSLRAGSSTTLATVKASTSAVASSSLSHTVQSRTTTLPPGSTSVPSNSSWSYAGCFVDTASPRTLPQWSYFNGPTMTNEACMSFCDSRGCSVAGTEYAGQCFCGASIDTAKLDEGKCNMPCTGDTTQFCGGPAALSVHVKGRTSSRRVEN